MLELEDIFYFYDINSIGGVETFFYQLAKQFKDRDITVIYNNGDIAQVERLKKYVRVVKYTGQKTKCKKAYFNYNTNIIDNVEAEEYIGLIHSDYKNISYTPNTHPKLTRFIAVSDIARKSFEELTGKKCEVIYNPYEREKPKRVLNLISATRLTKEKGKDRMIKLGEELSKAGIPYLWTIFTNDKKEIDNSNIVYMKPRLDIIDYIANADYLVQLSSAEAFCYSIVEALSVGTPVITTNLPVLKEIGVNETNSFILDFNMSNLNVKDFYTKKFNFTYTPPKSEWDKEITKSKSKYKEELKMKFKVIANNKFEEKNIICIDTGGIPKENEEFIVSKERLDVLLGDNKYNINFIKSSEAIIEETKEAKELKEEIKGSVIAQPYQPLPYKNEKTNPKTTTKKKVTKKK